MINIITYHYASVIKRNLYYLFSQFGEVLFIYMKKGNKNKGQAFVVMSNKHQSTLAKNKLDKQKFFSTNIVRYYYLILYICIECAFCNKQFK